MSAAKMSIQSHGLLHRPLVSLNKKELYDDLRISKLEIENRIGKNVSHLSLPHGSFNSYVINVAREIGYKKICTSLLGFNQKNEYLLKRIHVRSEYGLNRYENIITGRDNLLFLRLNEKLNHSGTII